MYGPQLKDKRQFLFEAILWSLVLCLHYVREQAAHREVTLFHLNRHFRIFSVILAGVQYPVRGTLYQKLQVSLGFHYA